jgi:hypothetical protein
MKKMEADDLEALEWRLLRARLRHQAAGDTKATFGGLLREARKELDEMHAQIRAGQKKAIRMSR